jgi:hypothetical protein
MGFLIKGHGMGLEWLVGQNAVDELNEIIVAEGGVPLNALNARALVFRDNGRIVGYSVVQLFPFVGPFWVQEDRRDGMLSALMAEETWKFLQECGARGFLVVASTAVSERFAQRYGMEKISDPVYLDRGKNERTFRGNPRHGKTGSPKSA